MKTSTAVKGLSLIALTIAAGLIIFDSLFSAPKIHRGIIVEKVFIPQHHAVSPYALPYGGYKSYKYTINSQKYHQWIAFVKSEDDTIKVHCTSAHYEDKKIGDTLLFKEYKGDLLGIDYLSHSEEDTVASDFKTFK